MQRHNRLFRLCVSAVVLGLAAGCGSEPGDSTAEVAPIAGRYEVSGTTIETSTGSEREISGTVILAEEGDAYKAIFHLATAFDSASGAIPAEVIGQGSGSIRERELEGIAETQIVMSTVPGVDPGFAFIPRMTSTRIISKSVASIAADGSLSIRIENEPAEGESYTPSSTTMRGKRIGAALADGGKLPPASSLRSDATE